MADSSRIPPANARQWSESMAKQNLKGQTVHGGRLASASQMGYDQFLLLRVLWKINKRKVSNTERIVTLLGLGDDFKRAETKLRSYQSWQTYFNGFSDSQPTEGTFAIVHHYRLEVAKTDPDNEDLQFYTPISKRTRSLQSRMQNLNLETPTRPSRSGSARVMLKMPEDNSLEFDEDDQEPHWSTDEEPSLFRPETPLSPGQERLLYPATKDEQIVNTSLLVFLNALTIHFNDVPSNWTLHRKAFRAKFEKAEYEARTDGYLSDNRGNTKVLLEVKPVRRSAKSALIQMQESAQMVAWIASDDYATQEAHKTRLHIAQDRHEIFLTIAQYDDDYLLYLRGPSASPRGDLPEPSFLLMEQFGPFSTEERSDFKLLAKLILAIGLQTKRESIHG